ncbi:MAG TPA: hypothetical protein VK447_17310, partial [Myxococcaceae bacterium]|nr:hypothetical protein [Myxococcaceae bacterium]
SAISRREAAADEEVTPPEFIEWMLKLKPKTPQNRARHAAWLAAWREQQAAKMQEPESAVPVPAPESAPAMDGASAEAPPDDVASEASEPPEARVTEPESPRQNAAEAAQEPVSVAKDDRNTAAIPPPAMPQAAGPSPEALAAALVALLAAIARMPPPVQRQRARGWAVAGFVVGALLVGGLLLAQGKDESPRPDPQEHASTADAVVEPPEAFPPSGTGIHAREVASGEMGNRSRAIPSRPYKGQKKEACDPEAAEVLINGGCWVPVGSAPCPSKTFEHEGKCYRPLLEGPKEPVSEERTRGEE